MKSRYFLYQFKHKNVNILYILLLSNALYISLILLKILIINLMTYYEDNINNSLHKLKQKN